MEARSPLVSLIIPVHGRRPLLEQALASVEAQTLTDWEAIVVDDRSPDDCARWLKTAAAREPRFRPISRTGELGGANVARNQGVAASAGKYVIFLDSDDLLEPDCLAIRTQILEAAPDLDFIDHAMRCFHQQPNDTTLAWNTLTDEDDFERFLRMDGPWQTTGATWRRSAVDRIGPWDPAVLSLQDLDYHLRALSIGLRYRKFNAWDCQYRLPQKRDSITTANRSLEHLQSHVLIVHRLLDLSDNVLDATPGRCDLLGGLCFLIARRCADSGDVRVAMRLWNHARRRGIVRPRRFAEGSLVLLTAKQPKLSAKLKHRLLRRWPADWKMEFRRTFLAAPLPVKAALR